MKAQHSVHIATCDRVLPQPLPFQDTACIVSFKRCYALAIVGGHHILQFLHLCKVRVLSTVFHTRALVELMRQLWQCLYPSLQPGADNTAP